MTHLDELIKASEDAKLEHQILLFELLGNDIDDALEDRVDAADFWPLLKETPVDLLAFLLGIKPADVPDYLHELWDIATENLEDIESSVDDFIGIQFDETTGFEVPEDPVEEV
jgi:hypothetical protein